MCGPQLILQRIQYFCFKENYNQGSRGSNFQGRSTCLFPIPNWSLCPSFGSAHHRMIYWYLLYCRFTKFRASPCKCTDSTLHVHEPRRKKTCLRGFADNKGADQPAHPHSLISASVIRFSESIKSRLAMILASLFSWGDGVGSPYMYVGNHEDRFCRDDAQLHKVAWMFKGGFCAYTIKYQRRRLVRTRDHVGLVATKPVFWVSDKAGLKPVFSAIESS